MTRFTPLLLLLALSLLTACGEKEEPARAGGGDAARQPFTVLLDYFPNADHAGLYAAEATGDYRRAGLDVKLQAPPDPSAPLKLLQAGKADVALSYTPEVLLARDKGADIVVVGALVQKPLTSIISLDGKVRSVRDLAGKRVGTAGISYQSAYLKTILERAGVDPGSVKETNVGFNFVAAMLSKRVDATLGAFWNYEGTDLQRRGRAPTVLRMDELGVPTYAELVFVVRRKTLDEQGAGRLRRFLQAVTRGHVALDENPDKALQALLNANPDLEPGLQRAVVAKTLPVMFPGNDRPFGYIEQRDWDAYVAWMRREKLLETEPKRGAGVTNEFLAGEGLVEGVQELKR